MSINCYIKKYKNGGIMKKHIITISAVSFFVLICIISYLNLSSIPPKAEENHISESMSQKSGAKDISNVKAVWLFYKEIASETDDKKLYKSKIESIFKDISRHGYNVVFVQVRAFADAFYKSNYFPASKYLNGGNVDFDALKIICDTAEKYKLDVHAWINPYRVSYDMSTTPNELMIKTESEVLYNPANEEARKLILNGVKELIDRYDIKGIHIDDYFYPADIADIDNADYELYVSGGGLLDKESWRRSNVNTLIKSIYTLLKNRDQNLILSISPGADIKKNYSSYFADVYAWCGNDGYCDWIIPQIYFGFENSNMPFISTLNSWENLIKSNKVKLIPGLPAYKQGEPDEFAGDGKNEFVENDDVISREIDEIKKRDTCHGYAIYSYSYIDSVK